MAVYATLEDVKGRMSRAMTEEEQTVANTLLGDAGVIVDSYNPDASSDAKRIVSCRMIVRALGDGDTSVPIGATQGSVTGLGYSESWTMSSGSAGELYLSKLEKKILGVGNRIGTYSPVQEMVASE